MINAMRSAAPDDLDVASGVWRTAGVVDTLHRDFRGKCYLCEVRIEPASFHIDHLELRHEEPDAAMSWANLFPACVDCNESRPKRSPDGGWLDPTEDDVEVALDQRLIGHAYQPAFEAVDPDDRAATNTATFLHRRHNAEAVKSLVLRDRIKRRVAYLFERFAELRRLEDEGRVDSVRWREVRAVLRSLVSRSAEFTALVRSRASDFPRLEGLFD